MHQPARCGCRCLEGTVCRLLQQAGSVGMPLLWTEQDVLNAGGRTRGEPQALAQPA